MRGWLSVLSQSYPWSVPAWGLGCTLATGCWLSVFRWFAKGRKKTFFSVLLAITLFSGVVGSCAFVVSSHRMFERAWTLHKSGRDRVVEGVVTAAEMTAGGTAEIIVLGDKSFAVSDYSLGPGYNVTSQRGGVIKKGAWVRIHYEGNRILEIEVAAK
jgi:hypothetical protein